VAAVSLGLLLVAVAKGSLFWVRREWAPLTGDFIDDIWVQSAFVALSALVLVLAWPAGQPPRFAAIR
jgi:hypothetical protein